MGGRKWQGEATVITRKKHEQTLANAENFNRNLRWSFLTVLGIEIDDICRGRKEPEFQQHF